MQQQRQIVGVQSESCVACIWQQTEAQSVASNEMISTFCRWNLLVNFSCPLTLTHTHTYSIAGYRSHDQWVVFVVRIFTWEKLIFPAKLLIWKMCQKQLPVSFFFSLAFLLLLLKSCFCCYTRQRCRTMLSRPNIRTESEKKNRRNERRKMHEEIKNHHVIKIVRRPFRSQPVCSCFNAIFIYSRHDSNLALHAKKEKTRWNEPV